MDGVIRHAESVDGTRIACWSLGSGRPLVYMAGGPWNHIEIWEVPQCRAWSERLARHRMVVRYDVRGTGLSSRQVSDFSLDAYVNDLEAVVQELGLHDFDLFAAGDAGPVAITYATRHPANVSRIVTWCSWARGAEFESSPRIQAWRGLIDKDWELMSETCAHLAFGWDAGAIGRRASEAFMAAIDRENAQIALETTVSVDVTALLPGLRQPTLIIHRNAVSWLPVDIALRLAADIPGSLLAIVEGETVSPYLGDSETVARLVDEFLDGAEPSLAIPGTEAPSVAPHIPGERSQHPMISRGQRTVGVVEILPFRLKDGRIVRYEGPGDTPWRIAFDPGRHPGEVVREELAGAAFAPVMVHSTSWRIDNQSLVLTYAAVVTEPDPAVPFRELDVNRRELARGTAMAAPEEIDIEDVAEHALRHLAWLAGEDEAVSSALGAEWQEALFAFDPQPFSAFDLSGSLSEEDGCLLCTRFSRPLADFVEEKTKLRGDSSESPAAKS